MHRLNDTIIQRLWRRSELCAFLCCISEHENFRYFYIIALRLQMLHYLCICSTAANAVYCKRNADYCIFSAVHCCFHIYFANFVEFIAGGHSRSPFFICCWNTWAIPMSHEESYMRRVTLFASIFWKSWIVVNRIFSFLFSLFCLLVCTRLFNAATLLLWRSICMPTIISCLNSHFPILLSQSNAPLVPMSCRFCSEFLEESLL